MPAAAQHLLNQIADGRFPLRKLLGVSPNSAVFLTSAAPPRPRDPNFDAAIKLIPADPATSDLQLDRWRAAAALSHPGLLRIFHFGSCIIDGSPCLYIVTELADEDLGQLLPRRALTADETRGMLASFLPTLDFLHANGLVHAGLKPSNIHATGDNVKLSADRILPAGESASTSPLTAPFAAPESILFPPADIWSLGISLCETLTKNLPEQAPSGQFALPELPAPFSEIVRSALVADATLRITLDQVRALLDPSFIAKRETPAAEIPLANSATPATNDVSFADSHAVAASPYVRPPDSPNSPESILAAAQADSALSVSTASTQATPRGPHPQVDPLAIPWSPVTPNAAPQPTRSRIPVSSLPHVNAAIGGPRRVATTAASSAGSNKFLLIGVAVAIGLALLIAPRYLLRTRNSSAPNPPNASATSSAPKNSSGTATKTPPPAANSIPANSSPSSKSNAATNSSALNPAPAPANFPSKAGRAAAAATSAPAVTHAPSDVNPASPSVLHKVLPEVSAKARSTIYGTVRINVRVQLNPDGSVSSAELNSPAASPFFANLALKAARQWQFAPPSSSPSGSSSSGPPASAVLRFDFTQSSTTAYLP
jgi:TonB family protein